MKPSDRAVQVALSTMKEPLERANVRKGLLVIGQEMAEMVDEMEIMASEILRLAAETTQPEALPTQLREIVVRQAVINWNRARTPQPLSIDNYEEGDLADAVLTALRQAILDTRLPQSDVVAPHKGK